MINLQDLQMKYVNASPIDIYLWCSMYLALNLLSNLKDLHLFGYPFIIPSTTAHGLHVNIGW